MTNASAHPETVPAKGKQEYSASFPPVVGETPRVLILGTLPGQESLRQQQYYAHPRNAFWKILFQIFKKEFTTDYAKRLIFLMENKIALWDICRLGTRKGSLDSAIKHEIPNEIPLLIKNHPSIKNVFFNGKKAEQLFGKYFEREARFTYTTLLSTSPANARYHYAQKLKNWRQIKQTKNESSGEI